MGVKVTRVVKFIRKGDTGEKGERGPSTRGPQAWSDCATGYAFQAGAVGDQFIDIVMYGNNYYECIKSHTKTASNYPGSTTDINNKLWKLGDKVDLIATKILLATYALVKNLGVEAIDMKDADGNILFQAKDGNVTCKTGTFDSVTLTNIKGMTGSFKNLDCVNNAGTRVGGISFGTDGRMWFDGDLYSQGYDASTGRGYRFYTSDVWCRGMFGARQRSVLKVVSSYACYYPNGVTGVGIYVSLESKKDSSNNTYYEVQCYGQSGDYSGMPVDTVVFATSYKYSYELLMASSQRCMVINSNNNYSIWIYSHGAKVEWVGGAMAEVVKVEASALSPSQGSTILGRGLFVGAFRDNNW